MPMDKDKAKETVFCLVGLFLIAAFIFGNKFIAEFRCGVTFSLTPVDYIISLVVAGVTFAVLIAAIFAILNEGKSKRMRVAAMSLPFIALPVSHFLFRYYVSWSGSFLDVSTRESSRWVWAQPSLADAVRSGRVKGTPVMEGGTDAILLMGINGFEILALGAVLAVGYAYVTSWRAKTK